MAKDAWEKLHNLLERFTRTTQVRPDIEVIAHATDRSVELLLSKKNPNADRLAKNKTIYMSTDKRNVGTMRELAKALNDACDFVEKSNPEWTKRKG